MAKPVRRRVQYFDETSVFKNEIGYKIHLEFLLRDFQMSWIMKMFGSVRQTVQNAYSLWKKNSLVGLKKADNFKKKYFSTKRPFFPFGKLW